MSSKYLLNIIGICCNVFLFICNFIDLEKFLFWLVCQIMNIVYLFNLLPIYFIDSFSVFEVIVPSLPTLLQIMTTFFTNHYCTYLSIHTYIHLYTFQNITSSVSIMQLVFLFSGLTLQLIFSMILFVSIVLIFPDLLFLSIF